MRATETIRTVAAHVVEGDELPMSYLPIAIPYFLVRLTAICVERRDLGVTREFALRAIHVGLTDVTSIAAFLGIKERDAAIELASLQDELFVSKKVELPHWVLLEKGLRALGTNGITRSLVKEAACVVNGISRQVESTTIDLVARKRLPNPVLILPAVPARSPRIEEIDLSAVKSVMMAAKSAIPRLLEVSRLGRVVRTTGLFTGGSLLVRRGTKSVPILCVDGAANQLLAQKIGPHPAFQATRGLLSKHEHTIRRNICQQCTEMRSVRSMDAQARVAMGRLVAFSDASGEAIEPAQKAFFAATKSLVIENHWIASAEAQAIFAFATLFACEKLVVVAPASSNAVFSRETFEFLANAISRGIKVELHIQHNDYRFTKNSGALAAILKKATIVPLGSNAVWCGLTCDQSFTILGSSKLLRSSMGEFEAFSGALVASHNSGKLLEFFAGGAGIPVTVKRKKKLGT